MKNSEIKALSLDELTGKLAAEKESYGKLKFAHSVTPIENPIKIKDSRRLIARIETEMRAKELSK
jgi:large subunit ribosomal protein L29